MSSWLGIIVSGLSAVCAGTFIHVHVQQCKKDRRMDALYAESNRLAELMGTHVGSTDDVLKLGRQRLCVIAEMEKVYCSDRYQCPFKAIVRRWKAKGSLSRFQDAE